MTPGDLTYIRAGIYAESVNITSSGNATQGNINLLAYPGEIPTLDGGSNIALQSSAATNYWNVQGLILQSTNRYTVQIGWWGDPNNTHWTFSNNRIHGSLLIKGSNNLISSNDVSGIYPDGTQYGSYPGQDQGDAGIMDIDGSNHNIIRANNVHDFSNVDGRGIWTQGFTHDDLIENNVVTNIVPTGGIGQSIDLDGAATVEWNHTVRGNKITGNNYVGIQLENVFNSLVENNVVRDTGAAGIILINYDSTIGCATAGTSGSPYGDTNGNGSCKDELSSDVIRQNLIIASTGWEYGGIINWGVRQPSVLGNSVYSLADAGNAEINYPDIAPDSEQSFLKTIVTSFLTVWRGIFNK